MADTLEPFKLDAEEENRLKKMGVCALYLFGSHAQGTAGPGSDFDFAVLLEDASQVKPGESTLGLYHELYDFLTDFLPGQDREPVVDIVFLQGGVSLELQANVVKHGKILYDANPQLRLAYEEQVMIRMADFRPVLAIMDEAILNRT